jgi:hypothetical protein
MIMIFVFIICLFMHAGHAVSTKLQKTRVVISGMGPAGLLTAHSLLSRGDRYEVLLAESRGDPRKSADSPRAYSLGLNVRGQKAIKEFDKPGRSYGLFKRIQDKGVFSDSFFLHLGKWTECAKYPSSETFPPAFTHT